MPTEEKKAEYNENKKKKRRQDRFEAMPEAQALRAKLSGLQRSMAGEGVYMESADEWSALRGAPYSPGGRGGVRTPKRCGGLCSVLMPIYSREPDESDRGFPGLTS